MPKRSNFQAVACILLFIAQAAIAAPRIAPSLKGELGILNVRTEKGWLKATVEKSAACSFEPGRRVLLARFESDVLVGSLVICQSPTSMCIEREVPFMGFVDEHTGEVWADVKLEHGCSSPALKGSRLSLAPTPKRGTPNKKELTLRAKQNASATKLALTNARALLEKKDFQRSAAAFERALSFDERNGDAYTGLVTAHLELGQSGRAMQVVERAKSFAPALEGRLLEQIEKAKVARASRKP
jgi:hypothetical protein